jgi:hypothetical protein
MCRNNFHINLYYIFGNTHSKHTCEFNIYVFLFLLLLLRGEKPNILDKKNTFNKLSSEDIRNI